MRELVLFVLAAAGLLVLVNLMQFAGSLHARALGRGTSADDDGPVTQIYYAAFALLLALFLTGYTLFLIYAVHLGPKYQLGTAFVVIALSFLSPLSYKLPAVQKWPWYTTLVLIALSVTWVATGGVVDEPRLYIGDFVIPLP